MPTVAIFAKKKKQTLAPSGYRVYASRAKNYVPPRWGTYRIRDIQKTDIETCRGR